VAEETSTGIACGDPWLEPGCAVKFSTFGLALRSVNPPTVIVTVTIVGFAVLFTVLTVKEVS
jgi:hypothetical protein